MKEFKKVSGERVVAALVDYVAMQVLGLVVTIVPMIFIGFDNFFDMFFVGAVESGAGDIVSSDFLIYTLATVYGGFVVGIIYFVVVPWKWKGQTVGKKLLKLKAVNEYGENPNFFQHFVRAIQNWTTYYTGLIGWVIIINTIAFSVLSIFSFVISIGLIVAFIMMLAREDGRGLHDLISGTYVIKADENLDRHFAETTAQMGDWVEVEDQDDDWDKEKEEKDEWDF